MIATDKIKPKPEPDQELVQGASTYDTSHAEERIRIALLRHQALAARIVPSLGPTDKKERL